MDIKASTKKPPRHYPWDVLGSYRYTVGVLWPCYGSGHVIYGLNCHRYNHRTLAKVTLQRLDSASTYFKITPIVLDASVPLLHTFNVIPANKDFIVSFELELPRYLGSPSHTQLRRGMRWLEGPRCKKILALSEFAYRYARKRLEKNGFSGAVAKLAVFRGAIADPLRGGPLPIAPRASFDDKPFSAIVIGSELFRKGGMHAIRAFERLREAGLNVHLTLIGRFESECYAFRECIPNADEWRARAASHDWIQMKAAVPNAQVFEELRAHDICLYPSMDESLGWLTIEAGMLGVPVVGNRICAFPELIQHQRTGWLIDLPVDDDGRWAGIGMQGAAHREAVDEACETIVDGLTECVRHLYAAPHLLREWGLQARSRMRELYDVDTASAELERTYDLALGRVTTRKGDGR